MSYSNAKLRRIFNKTRGACRCCGKSLVFANYAERGGARGRWEVGHGRSRARGGSDAERNLWPMCRDCNRGMGITNARKWC